MSELAERQTSDADVRPEPDADAVASVVQSLPTVRLSGRSGVATYLPGRRVGGVRLDAERAEVHVAVVYPTTVMEGAAAVRDALAAVIAGQVDVVVDDVITADDIPSEPASGPRPDIDQPKERNA